MQTKTVLFAFLSLMGVASASPVGNELEPRAVVKRTASVSVRNNTPHPISAVSVIHKYSDNYKNQHQWGRIPANQLAEESFNVEYNTGFGTTGRDWWLVAFYNEDMKKLYFTNPKNLRPVVDALEGLAPGLVSVIASAGAGLAASSGGPVASAAAKRAAQAAAKVTTDALFNSASTAGFKQHILREEDANQLNEIIINPDYTVTFRSKSGDSTTTTAERSAPGQK